MPSKPENTVMFWFDLITMSMGRSIWTGVNNMDLKGWPSCSQKNCTQGDPLLGLGSQKNGTSRWWVSTPTWAIRLCSRWIPDLPQCLLSRNCCLPLTLLVLDYGSGFRAFIREYPALLRQSQAWFFALCYELGRSQSLKSIPKGWRQRALSPTSEG